MPPLHIVVSPEAWDAAWADGLRPGPAFTDKLLADAMADELRLTRYWCESEECEQGRIRVASGGESPLQRRFAWADRWQL
jgi:hypothetical protein